MTQPSPAATPPPSSPPADASSVSTKSTQRGGGKDNGSVKETIESILVAFILAFIFRAFVVEAFVIPTGSMAPTLLGAHMRFTCNDCGWRFDANYSPETTAAGDDLYIPSTSSKTFQKAFCPNCGYKIPTHDVTNPANDTHQPDVHYGDRILVLKYLYLFEKPQRWDVVVFKSPANDDASGEKPTYQQNYIKRLIGNPGESVLILDGDIYVGREGQEVTQYEVQTKPRHVQDALWRVIYDNDYHPQQFKRGDGSGEAWRQPWTVRDGSGWDLADKATQGRVFRFDNATGASTLFFDRTANPIAARAGGPEPFAFTDWLAYDSPYAEPSRAATPPMNVVRDLKLAFFYHRSAGDGPLRVQMTSGDHAFVAILTPTEAKLVQVTRDGETPIGEPMKLEGVRSPIRVKLTNVDYQVTLRINDEPVARTTPEHFRPDVARLLEDYKTDRKGPQPTVEITAANQTAALSHIGLWRDVYYLNRASGGQSLVWGVPRDLPNHIIHLGPEEYFVLGDNALISGDARYWQVPIDLPADRLQVPAGRVPGRFMLGKAFFVYWPAGFRPAPGLPGLAPNFGDMRFIR